MPNSSMDCPWRPSTSSAHQLYQLNQRHHFFIASEQLINNTLHQSKSKGSTCFGFFCTLLFMNTCLFFVALFFYFFFTLFVLFLHYLFTLLLPSFTFFLNFSYSSFLNWYNFFLFLMHPSFMFSLLVCTLLSWRGTLFPYFVASVFNFSFLFPTLLSWRGTLFCTFLPPFFYVFLTCSCKKLLLPEEVHFFRTLLHPSLIFLILFELFLPE